MKHEGNSSAVLFLAIVWMVFLLILAHGVYKEAINLSDPRSFRLHKLEDLMNDNP